jgi:hypothetical protein
MAHVGEHLGTSCFFVVAVVTVNSVAGAGYPSLKSVILATWEVEIRRIMV